MMTGRDRKLAGNGAGEVGNVAFDVFQFAQDGAGAQQQRLAGWREVNLAPDAVKQARADILFQRGDALADGRLGQKDALGGTGK